MTAEPVEDGCERVAADSSGAAGHGRLRLAGRHISRRVRAGLSLPAGPERLAAVIRLVTEAATPAGRLSAREWVEVNVAMKEVVSFCQGLQLVAVRELDRALDPAGQDGAPQVAARRAVAPGRRAADELAPALGIAPRTATCLVLLARRLEDELPAAADALVEGRLDLTQVRALDEVTAGLPAPVVRAVEATAVREGPQRTAAQLRTRLEAEAARLDPEFTARSARRGVDERDVRLTRSPLPGCRRLLVDLPALHAVSAWNAVNGAARAARREGCGGGRDDRSLPQLRADIAAAVLTGTLTGTPTGADGAGDDEVEPLVVPTGAELARHAEVQVVVSAQTLTGRSDLPAHLAAVGPLDAVTAREVAAVAPWRRLVADPDLGTLVHRDRTSHPPQSVRASTGGSPAVRALDDDPRWAAMAAEPPTPVDGLTTAAYRPGQRLAAHVRTREQTCIGPACEHSTVGSEIDHTVDHGKRGPDGRRGTTAAANLGAVCHRAHDTKTHGGWELRQPAPGSFTWTSPTGRQYPVTARPLVPAWTSNRPASLPEAQPP